MKRNQQSEAVRAAILAAARKLFLSKGYEATTVRDICDASGVSLGSLYHFFGSKDGVFGHQVRELITLTARGSDAIAAEADDPFVTLGVELGLQIHLMSADLRLAKLYQAAHCSEPISRLIVDVASQRKWALLNPRFPGFATDDAYRLTIVAKALIAGLTQERIASGRLNPEQGVDLMLRHCFGGLGLGRARIDAVITRVSRLLAKHHDALVAALARVELEDAAQPQPAKAAGGARGRK